LRGREFGSVRWAVFGLGLMAAVIVALAPARPASAEDQEARYRDCIQLSQRDPAKAYDQAQDWHDNGGGGASRHCAALALIGMGRYEDAATVLQQLAADIQISPTASPLGEHTGETLRADLLSQSGNAWLMAKQYNSARTVLTDALKYVVADSPVARDILIDRARAEGGDRDFDSALNDLDKAIQIDPGAAEAYIYKASALRETDQVDLAASTIETALRLDPGNLDALLERGYIRQIQKNYIGARDDWQRVEDDAKGSPIAEQAEKNLATLDGGPANAGSQESPPDPASHSAPTSPSDSPAK
jgi:tetratricopeptide (TPR) repeat protein